MAGEYLKEFEYRTAKKQLGQQTNITLDNLRDEYLNYSKATKKTSTHERHDLPRVTRLVDYLKGLRLTKASQITQAHVENYQTNLLQGLSPQRVRHCMHAASGLLSFAVRCGYLSSNVVKNVKKVKAEKNPPRYLSFEEWKKVEEIARHTYLRPLVAGIDVGARPHQQLGHLCLTVIGGLMQRGAALIVPSVDIRTRSSQTFDHSCVAGPSGIVQWRVKKRVPCIHTCFPGEEQLDYAEIAGLGCQVQGRIAPVAAAICVFSYVSGTRDLVVPHPVNTAPLVITRIKTRDHKVQIQSRTTKLIAIHTIIPALPC